MKGRRMVDQAAFEKGQRVRVVIPGHVFHGLAGTVEDLRTRRRILEVSTQLDGDPQGWTIWFPAKQLEPLEP